MLNNPVLWLGLTALGVAQLLKVPLHYFQHHEWHWGKIISPGGMPSSHSALVTAAVHAVGLWQGFNTPLFGVGVAFAVIVMYDASGVRRQAGKHAELLNMIIRDFAIDHQVRREHQQQLKEVLGHTPAEVFWGIFLGLLTAQIGWLWLR